MVSSKLFVRQVERSLEEALVARGFQRLRAGRMVFDIAPGFLGWVGLHRGVRGGSVRVRPHVGIHCEPVMKLCAELEGQRYRRGAVASFADPLETAEGRLVSMEFTAEADPDQGADRLASVIDELGLPSMRKLASFEALEVAIHSRVPSLGGYPERYAALLHLTGRRAEAVRFVTEQRMVHERYGPAVLQSFDRFAGPFLKLLGHEPETEARDAQVAESMAASLAVVVCQHVASGERPALRMVRDAPLEAADSGWQCLCGQGDDVPDLASVWTITELMEMLPDLAPWLDAGVGTQLRRQDPSGPWVSTSVAGDH